MSDHEVRRAISMGPFTKLLDELADRPEISEALGSRNCKPDEIQNLVLRYYSMEMNPKEFGKPSHLQQGLATMIAKNKEMNKWSAGESSRRREELTEPLLGALKLLCRVFRKDELFCQPTPLVKNG